MRSLVFACIGLPNLIKTISIISCTTFQKITAMKVKLYYAISKRSYMSSFLSERSLGISKKLAIKFSVVAVMKAT